MANIFVEIGQDIAKDGQVISVDAEKAWTWFTKASAELTADEPKVIAAAGTVVNALEKGIADAVSAGTAASTGNVVGVSLALPGDLKDWEAVWPALKQAFLTIKGLKV